jgi:hypothetical protein
MNIFGKQVSIAVLLTGLFGLGLTALGLVQNIVTGWSGHNASADYLLISGVITTLVNAAVHTWDTMPANVTAAVKPAVPLAPPPPPAPPAAA